MIFNISKMIPQRIFTQEMELVWEDDTPSRSVDFLPNGDIVCASNNQLVLYDKAGHSRPAPLDEAGLGDVWRVAVHRESNTLAVIPVNGNFFTVIRAGDPPWSYVRHDMDFFGLDCDVAFDPQGQLVITTGDGRVVKYSTEGNLVWQNGLGCEGNYVTVAGNGRISVTDKSGHLNVHSENGNMLYQIPRETDTDKLGRAKGTCADPMNNIYVVDSKRHVLAKFDKDGVYIQDVITGLNIKAGYYSDVSIYKDRLVMSSGGGFLALYKFVG